MGEWPWPKDTPADRYKRIIDSYRSALIEADPQICRTLDARMAELGQAWIAAEMIIDVEQLVTPHEVSELFDVNPWNIHDWARRHPDRLPKRGKKNGKTLFRLGDIIKYQAEGGRR